MKKFYITLNLAFLGAVSLFATTRIILSPGHDNPETTIPGGVKMPLRIPIVEQEGSQLIFETNHTEFTLELMQDGEVVYSIIVPTTTTVISIPSWLTGDFAIRLLTGGAYYFYGDITL